MEYCTNGLRVVRSLDDLKFVGQNCKKILTLFSGGLDSSYVLYELSRFSKIVRY